MVVWHTLRDQSIYALNNVLIELNEFLYFFHLPLENTNENNTLESGSISETLSSLMLFWNTGKWEKFKIQ
jgi:hypothetical protein